MAQKKKTNPVIIIIILVAIILLLNKSFPRMIPIGEEGFDPYDPLLEAGSYDTNLWLVPEQIKDYQGVWHSVNIAGAIKNVDEKLELEGNKGVASSARKNNCAYKEVPVCTRNLYLDDFIVEFQSCTTGKAYITGSNILEVGGNRIQLHNDMITRNDVWNCENPGSIELRWDDYENNHYNVFVNGISVVDDYSSDGDLSLCLIPGPYYGSYCAGPMQGKLFVYNPRYKKLFGCDTQGGELLASMTFSENDYYIDLAKLEGFKRFCVEHPSIFMDDGVSASSVRVYYALAQDERVYLEHGQIRRIIYVADAQELGVIQACEEGAFEIDYGCMNLTGLISIDENITIIEDKIDIDDVLLLIGNKKIRWSANHLRSSLKSASKTLFTVTPPKYSCGVQTDGFGDVREIIRSPYPSKDCYKAVVNNIDVGWDETVQINDYWKVTVKGIDARLTLEDGNMVYEDSDDWQVLLEIELIKDFFDIKNVEKSNEDAHVMTIDNVWDKEADAVILLVDDFEIVDYVQTRILKNELSVGDNEIILGVPKMFIGRNDVTATALLETDAGNLLASNVYKYSYIVDEDIDCTDGTKEYYVCTTSPVLNPGLLRECIDGVWDYIEHPITPGPCGCNDDDDCQAGYECKNYQCKTPTVPVACERDSECIESFYTYNTCLPWYKSGTELRYGDCKDNECVYETLNPKVCEEWQLFLQDNFLIVIIVFVVLMFMMLMMKGGRRGRY